jgi:predicted RNA binding protein with dsRBD fold (UPF0201 family)
VNNIDTNIEVEVNPTEDLEKVRNTIEVLFPEAALAIKLGNEKSIITAKTEGKSGLSSLYALLRQERILDAARRILRRAMFGQRITFYLNKQVAFVKHISFCEPVAESPLGPIKIEITCDDPKELINWLTPKSKKR